MYIHFKNTCKKSLLNSMLISYCYFHRGPMPPPLTSLPYEIKSDLIPDSRHLQKLIFTEFRNCLRFSTIFDPYIRLIKDNCPLFVVYIVFFNEYSKLFTLLNHSFLFDFIPRWTPNFITIDFT